jgi:hypothetical protein
MPFTYTCSRDGWSGTHLTEAVEHVESAHTELYEEYRAGGELTVVYVSQAQAQGATEWRIGGCRSCGRVGVFDHEGYCEACG